MRQSLVDEGGNDLADAGLKRPIYSGGSGETREIPDIVILEQI